MYKLASMILYGNVYVIPGPDGQAVRERRGGNGEGCFGAGPSKVPPEIHSSVSFPQGPKKIYSIHEKL
jgi:hypothetical protein